MMQNKPRLLFVDDDVNLLNALQRSLHKMKPAWSMQFVNSAEKALEICLQSFCDIVVTDLLMPKMNGIELVKQLNEKVPKTKCIMLSGTADLTDAVELINNTHILLFYTKPCETKVLISGIKKLLVEPSSESFHPTMESLISIFDLTRSEARLAQSLLIGKSLEEAAKDSGITLSSARTYIKRIFSKTDTNRQAELVSKVLLKLSAYNS